MKMSRCKRKRLSDHQIQLADKLTSSWTKIDSYSLSDFFWCLVPPVLDSLSLALFYFSYVFHHLAMTCFGQRWTLRRLRALEASRSKPTSAICIFQRSVSANGTLSLSISSRILATRKRRLGADTHLSHLSDSAAPRPLPSCAGPRRVPSH